MASASPEPTITTKSRHLRPRESVKKRPNQYLDSPTGSVEKKPLYMKMMVDEEDDELSANMSASHYLSGKGGTKRKTDGVTIHNTPKRRRVVHNGGNAGTTGETGGSSENATEELQDVYCWECHKECVDGALDCASCPRTYHPACIPATVVDECGKEPSENWICPVCLMIMKAECADTRSWAMQQLNIDQLATLLGFVLQRIKHSDVKTSEAFHTPVPRSLLPDYYDIVFHPMDLSTLDKNIKNKAYASTEAFLEDAKWIVHNSMLYNGVNNRTTQDSKLLIKICRQELSEIELCPDCYLNSCIKKENWFTEPCPVPHCLVWAKLKGFPFWPAKALRVSAQNNVDVRFFGAHDKAWIPINQVYLLSEECPLPMKSTKKYGMDKALSELQLHVKRLRDKFGEFNYAPPKTELKTEHLYFCNIFFGNNVANSDMAKKMLATAAGKRYRDMSGGGLDDQAPPSLSRKSTNSIIDDQASGLSIEDDQSSDAESRTNDSATPVQKSASQKETATVNEDLMANQESNDSIDSSSFAQPKNKPTSLPGPSPSQPPLRVRLNISAFNKRKLAEKALETSATARLVTQSPDSTSTTTATSNGPAASSPLASTTTNGIDQPANTSVQASKADAQRPGVQISEVSSVGQRPALNTSVTKDTNFPPPTSKDDSNEPAARKKTLQSVLEKMRANVQEQRHRSVSPINTEANPPVLPKLPDPQPRNLSLRTALDRRVNVGASTSTVDCGEICEKYQEKINEFVQAAMVEMKREMQSLTQTFPAGASGSDSQAQAQLLVLRGELTKMQIFYSEAIKAVKHTARAKFIETQQAMEAERTKTIEDLKRKFDEEKRQAIADTKLKQWCANCGKEAVFYCCWNTSYCDYPCQQQHWPKHQSTCAQIRQASAGETTAAHNPVSSPLVHSVQYVTNNRLSTGATSMSQAGQGGNVVYTTTLPSSGYIRTSLPTNAGQQGVANLAALVRKR